MSETIALTTRNATTAGGSTDIAPGPPAIEKIVENDTQSPQSCEWKPRWSCDVPRWLVECCNAPTCAKNSAKPSAMQGNGRGVRRNSVVMS